jgi:hypothetical protein
MIAEPLNFPKTVVLRILKKDLGKRKNFSSCTIMCPSTKLRLPIFDPKNVTTLYHPPYSPDLSLPEYFLFPKLKMKLKGLHFAGAAEIQEAVINELKKVQKEELSAAFQKLYNHAKGCIYANGAYFEKKKKLLVYILSP